MAAIATKLQTTLIVKYGDGVDAQGKGTSAVAINLLLNIVFKGQVKIGFFNLEIC